MEGLVGEAGKWLIQQGILGIVLLGMSWWIWDLGRKLHSSRTECKEEVSRAWAERFADYKANHESLGVLSQMVQDVVEVTKERTDAIKATAKAQEMSAAEISRLTAEAIRGREEIALQKMEIAGLRGELAKLREALVTRGLRPDG